MKQELSSTIWETNTYYKAAHEASERIDEHPSFSHFKRACQPLKNVLDVGCGEGTKMAHLLSPESKGAGVDISQRGISMAQKAYPTYDFQVADITKLPFADSSFDGVMTFFVLEHVDDPAKVMDEMIRVLQPNGLLMILCPNFGSPLFRSPCATKSRLRRMAEASLKSLRYAVSRPSTLEWDTVTPLDVSEDVWKPDYDTTVEPYLQTATAYLATRGFKLEYQSSMWEALDFSKPESQIQRPFKKLATHRIYPFQYWGPQLMLIARKAN